MPWILKISAFWKYRESKYTRVLHMFLVLNIPGFWMYHNSRYARVTQGSEYARIIPEYGWLCLIMPKSIWMVFVLYLPIVIYRNWKIKFGFFYSSWKYLIFFCFRLNIFASKTSNLLWGWSCQRNRGFWILPNKWDTQ